MRPGDVNLEPRPAALVTGPAGVLEPGEEPGPGGRSRLDPTQSEAAMQQGEPRDPSASPGICVVLGGGGARSIAHIGVLRAFAREGIRIDRIAGTSGGGMIAVLLAAGYPIADLEKDAASMEWRRIAELRPHPLGLLAADKLGEFVTRRVGHLRFEDLRIPCAVVATDLTACAGRVFDRGPIEPAVRATCAVPEFYRPVALEGHLFVDGGLVEPLPVETALAMSAACPLPCVAVSVQRPSFLSDSLRNPLQLLGRITDIVQQELTRRSAREADLLIEPEVGGFSFFNLEDVEGLIDCGDAAARGKLARLREILQDPARFSRHEKQASREGETDADPARGPDPSD
jgi:NTE family protein